MATDILSLLFRCGACKTPLVNSLSFRIRWKGEDAYLCKECCGEICFGVLPAFPGTPSTGQVIKKEIGEETSTLQENAIRDLEDEA